MVATAQQVNQHGVTCRYRYKTSIVIETPFLVAAVKRPSHTVFLLIQVEKTWAGEKTWDMEKTWVQRA